MFQEVFQSWYLEPYAAVLPECAGKYNFWIGNLFFLCCVFAYCAFVYFQLLTRNAKEGKTSPPPGALPDQKVRCDDKKKTFVARIFFLLPSGEFFGQRCLASFLTCSCQAWRLSTSWIQAAEMSKEESLNWKHWLRLDSSWKRLLCLCPTNPEAGEDHLWPRAKILV